MSDEANGIDRDHAHKRALDLVPEDFFWDCGDELAPFGSDEGDTALSEFRDWRQDNAGLPIINCVRWTVESVGEMDFKDYNDSLLSNDRVRCQIQDKEFDDQQYVFTLDVSVMATVFGQLVDEGKIDPQVKPVASIALARQKLWASEQPDWEYSSEYISNLEVLERVLTNA